MDEAHCRVIFVTSDRKIAVLTFLGCTQSVYGYPNDEAQVGHPMYSDWAYGIYEAVGSDWLERLELQNRISFPNQRWDAEKHHYIVTFPELMGEFLADGVQVEISPRGFDEIAMDALSSLLRDVAAPNIIPT